MLCSGYGLIASLDLARGETYRQIVAGVGLEPFVTRDGLRRVKGTGPKFLAQIDSLVMFSGLVKHPEASDTIIPKSKRRR